LSGTEAAQVRREKIHEQTIALSTKEKLDCFSAQSNYAKGESSPRGGDDFRRVAQGSRADVDGLAP
jgi:hypothetical protein